MEGSHECGGQRLLCEHWLCEHCRRQRLHGADLRDGPWLPCTVPTSDGAPGFTTDEHTCNFEVATGLTTSYHPHHPQDTTGIATDEHTGNLEVATSFTTNEHTDNSHSVANTKAGDGTSRSESGVA